MKPGWSVRCLQCSSCQHLLYDAQHPYGECEAYGLDIPPDLLFDKVRHDKPYPGDKGIQWEPDSEEDRRFVDALFAEQAEALAEGRELPPR